MVEIISAFHEGCGIRDVGITTNGTLEKTIIETVASVFDEKLVSNLSIQVSLDGLGATHDRIRGVKGAFDKAFSTVKELRRIQKTYPRLNVKTCLSVEKQNISELKDYVEYLLPLKLPLRFNIVRGGILALVQLNRQKDAGFKIIPVKTITYANYHAFPEDTVTY